MIRKTARSVRSVWNRAELFISSPAGVPLFLLALCILTYGPFIPWLGFYWDDQPWIWYMDSWGAEAAREIDLAFRPLSGLVLSTGYFLAGVEPAGWQIVNLAARWIVSCSIWWSLVRTWPQHKNQAVWTAAIFLVYPAYSHQFVSVNTSRHIFPFALMLFSFGLTALAIRHRKYRWGRISAAAALSASTMLMTDYYYGLEFLRAGVIWAVLNETSVKRTRARNLQRWLKEWAPYLLIQIVFFSWRFMLSRRINYSVSLLEEISSAPSSSLVEIVTAVLRGVFTATANAWAQILPGIYLDLIGPRKAVLLAAVILAVAFISLLYFSNLTETTPADRRLRDSIWFPALALLVAGIPFVVVDLQVSVHFPNDRMLLPYLFGGALLITALLHQFLPARHLPWVGSVLIGLAAGGQIVTASAFQQDWETQSAFFDQLTWRAPGIPSGTALLSEQLPFQFSTDNSLTAPLNEAFEPLFAGGNLPLILLNLENRLGTKVPALESGRELEISSYRSVFYGSTDQVLVIQFAPPACLRVLHPVYDRFLPGTSDLIDQALTLTRPEQIIESKRSFYDNPAETWCEYFQQADLARQAGDWAAIVLLGDTAFALNDSPNDASERLPFLEAYAMTGDFETAAALTRETIRIDHRSTEMLCAAWTRIEAGTPASNAKSAALQQIEELLSCGTLNSDISDTPS